MIEKDNCLLLGTLNRLHGTKGSLLLWVRDIKAEDIKKRDSVFVEIDGLLVPFFIESFQINSAERVLLKIDGIDSENKAKTLLGASVYILRNQVKRKKKTLDEGTLLEGYKVIDKTLGFVGTAKEITGIASNPLLLILQGDKEFLIPIHEDVILEINEKIREIRINAPEGLFEL
jgi:16S rRNA processing protein RimM